VSVIAVAGLLAGAAVWVLLARPAVRLARLDRSEAARRTPTWPRPHRLRRLSPAAGPPVAAAAAGWVAGPVPALLVLALGAFALQRRTRAVRDRTSRELRRSVLDVCGVLVGELRAGRSPAQALLLAAESAPSGPLSASTTAASRAGDVAAGLRADALRPGADALHRLAACWAVAADRGAGLARPAARLLIALRDEQAAERELDAQLAAPRATARLLAALPAAGIALGMALGADPLGVLLHTPVGLACLTCGVALGAVGVLWVDRLAAGARAGGAGPPVS
jgi:tight adherence protein B